jgi:hypothetical protein
MPSRFLVRFVYLSFFSFWTLCCLLFRFKFSDYLFSQRKSPETRVIFQLGQSWSWSYGSWIFNYLCNQCLSPLMLNPTQERCTRCKIMGTEVSSTNKTDCHDITEILLKVALSTVVQTNGSYIFCMISSQIGVGPRSNRPQVKTASKWKSTWCCWLQQVPKMGWPYQQHHSESK